jgi:sulfur-oxidizing protein SoxX
MLLKILATIGFCVISTYSFAGNMAPESGVFKDGAVFASLTGGLGDPLAGRKSFINRKLGNCLACHVNADASEQSFHGEVGPSLDGVADRWEEADLRGLVINSKMMNEGTIMPAFYSVDNGIRPLKKFTGKTILNAQQVEDIVAYLLTLKEN